MKAGRAAGRATAEASGEMIDAGRAAGRATAEASGEMIERTIHG
jgi:hypothetical protein